MKFREIEIGTGFVQDGETFKKISRFTALVWVGDRFGGIKQFYLEEEVKAI